MDSEKNVIKDSMEEIVNFGKNNSIVGILTNPSDNGYASKDICIILINAGLIHKVGPNGVYVKLARTLAQKGVASFRFDFSGLGDSENSDGLENIEKIKISEIQMAMDSVCNKLGIKRFILTGICTGAEDAFRASLVDERIVGLIPIDGVYLERDKLGKIVAIAARNCIIRYYKKHFFSIRKWVGVIIGKSNAFNKKNIIVAFNLCFSVFLKFFKNIFRKKSILAKDTDDTKFKMDNWLTLFKREVKIYLIFSEGSSMIDVFRLTFAQQLEEYKPDNELLKIDLIKDVDHTFTSIWSQDLLIALISNWVARF